jgi:hypothetical protein
MRRALPVLALVLTAAVLASGCKLPRRKQKPSSDPYPVPTYTAPTGYDDDPLPTTPSKGSGAYKPASGLLELHFPGDFEAQKMRGRACIFVKGGKGYSFMYRVPDRAPSRDLAALKGVVDSTVLL